MSLWTVELNRRASKDFRELDFNGKESARDIMAELEEEGPAEEGKDGRPGGVRTMQARSAGVLAGCRGPNVTQ